MNRRDVLASGALALAGLGVPRTARAQMEVDAPRRRLRTITYNVLACGGSPYDERTKPRLDVARSRMDVRFALELFVYQPDLVSFQEAPSEVGVASIARRLDMNYCFFPSPGSWPGAILTRYDVVESTNCPLKDGARPAHLFTRHFGRAVLATDDGELVVYSAHLLPGGADDERMQEVHAILSAMEPDLASGRSLIFQGDLNHSPEQDEYARWTEAGLVDAFAAAGDGPTKTWPSDEPKWRIDYVFAHGPIVERLRECRVLFEGPFRTNPADSGSFALSDHLPVMATFA